MTETEKDIELLDFPVELLLKITGLVQDPFELSLVCKKFYLLVHERKKYKINIRSEDMILDFPTYCGILSTSLDIDSIEFTVPVNKNELFWTRLAKIITPRTFSSMKMNDKRSILNAKQIPEIFIEAVREDSLKELTLNIVDLRTWENIFLNQKLIESLSISGYIDESSVESIRHLNLKSLTLTVPGNILETVSALINAQPKLKKLVIDFDNVIAVNFSDHISQISCLHQLEELKLPRVRGDLARLAELRNLKKVTIFTGSSIPSIHSLEELYLTVDCITENEFMGLSKKLPNLKIATVKGELAINCLNGFTSSFRNLESLSVLNEKAIYCKIVQLPQDFANSTLKHLRIINKESKVAIYAADLIQYLKSFERLETLVLSVTEISFENLQRLLISSPSIRELAIDLNQKCSSSIETFRQLASELNDGKLEYLEFINFRSDCDEDELRNAFGETFPVIERRGRNLVLRKYGKFRLQTPAIDNFQ